MPCNKQTNRTSRLNTTRYNQQKVKDKSLRRTMLKQVSESNIFLKKLDHYKRILGRYNKALLNIRTNKQ